MSYKWNHWWNCDRCCTSSQTITLMLSQFPQYTSSKLTMYKHQVSARIAASWLIPLPQNIIFNRVHIRWVQPPIYYNRTSLTVHIQRKRTHEFYSCTIWFPESNTFCDDPRFYSWRKNDGSLRTSQSLQISISKQERCLYALINMLDIAKTNEWPSDFAMHSARERKNTFLEFAFYSISPESIVRVILITG